MSDKFIKKVVASIKKNIEMCNDEITKISENLSKIDEKYRKMAEEAKKELKSDLDVLNAEREIWQDSLKRYNIENENAGVESTENTESASEEESQNDSLVNEYADAMPEDEGAVSAETTKEPEEGVVVDDLFPENNEPAEEQKTIGIGFNVMTTDPIEGFEGEKNEGEESSNEEDKDENDEWPDLPEDWK